MTSNEEIIMRMLICICGVKLKHNTEGI